MVTIGSGNGPDAAWLERVVAAGVRGSSAPSALLGDFPEYVLGAAVTGRRPDDVALRAIRDLGRLAAEQGVPADTVVNLYLSVASRIWRELPREALSRNAAEIRGAAGALLGVVADAAAALVSGHQAARQQMIRQEQTARQEFLDDLLRGDADVARMVERAEPFGLDLGAAHHVVLAAPPTDRVDIDRAALTVERSIVDTFGDRDVLVGRKDGRLVLIVPGAAAVGAGSSETTLELARLVQARVAQATRSQGTWRVAAGRAFAGAYGIARTYEEAREALHLADQLGIDTFELNPGQLLVNRVIGRDLAAVVDLIDTVLSPLSRARGGAAPLFETLRAYFECSAIATETARTLHVSVRTVTYRLQRVRQLTGYNPALADHRFVLQTAVQGARLLGWPDRELPSSD